MIPLPRLMVAPNGARLGKVDHPALPITLDEIVTTARRCHTAGADGLHLHMRDARGGHILDAGLYREALGELSRTIPEMVVQITTEAVGIYSADHQRNIALTSGARLVSTSIRELMTGTEPQVARRFFDDCRGAGISLQIILYDSDDLELLQSVMAEQMFRAPDLQVLFVLGRYSVNRDSNPNDLLPFLDQMKQKAWHPDWAVCAFGQGETACLRATHEAGGKLRVGFENSLFSADGTIARDNAQRVSEISLMMQRLPAA